MAGCRVHDHHASRPFDREIEPRPQPTTNRSVLVDPPERATRVMSTANQVNLDFEDAAPELTAG
jgi:hypothetical protein